MKIMPASQWRNIIVPATPQHPINTPNITPEIQFLHSINFVESSDQHPNSVVELASEEGLPGFLMAQLFTGNYHYLAIHLLNTTSSNPQVYTVYGLFHVLHVCLPGAFWRLSCLEDSVDPNRPWVVRNGERE